MASFAIIAKVVTIAVAGGVAVSSITVPSFMSLNFLPKIAIGNFPLENKLDYQEKCQVLIQDSTKKNYLLVCRDESTSPELRYFSETEKKEPEKVQINSINRQGDGVLEITLGVLNRLGDSLLEVKSIRTSSVSWANLHEKVLKNCDFLSMKEDAPWRISCETGVSGTAEKKELTSTLLVIK